LAQLADESTDISTLTLAAEASVIALKLSQSSETLPQWGASRTIRPTDGTQVLGRYHRANKIAENRRHAYEIVRLVAGVRYIAIPTIAGPIFLPEGSLTREAVC
jgi:hypothetical protein